MAAQDEQGVVDADPEPDHGAQSGSDRGDVDQCAQQPDDRQSDGEPEQRHTERQDRRVDAAEGDEQNDQSSDDADHLGRARVALLQHRGKLPAVLDLHPGRLSRQCGCEQSVDGVTPEVGGGPVELHRRERGRPVGRHRPRAGEWFGHRDDMIERPNLAQRSLRFRAPDRDRSPSRRERGTRPSRSRPSAQGTGPSTGRPLAGTPRPAPRSCRRCLRPRCGRHRSASRRTRSTQRSPGRGVPALKRPRRYNQFDMIGSPWCGVPEWSGDNCSHCKFALSVKICQAGRHEAGTGVA